MSAKSFSLIAVAVLLVVSDFGTSASARGGYPMNSPGYQRRLQESRGYVTNRSISLSDMSPFRKVYRLRHRSR
jgi:hypothetical protein